jgi:hypothetical protein
MRHLIPAAATIVVHAATAVHRQGNGFEAESRLEAEIYSPAREVDFHILRSEA